ncbi:DUF1844 domain-containing protein [Sorangium sp. So ce131]|uniref:DUF1844 domain-containing protein n=1 Tax=Sorangium sp. So ce131 TaxID=3133282 RepID=UPI003F6156CB
MSDTNEQGDSPNEGAPELPTLDFSTFVLSIIGSAYVHLGDAPSPDGGLEQNLVLAHQDIDLLSLLQEKTKGNLTGDEERLLEQALYDLRMRYLEVSKRS